MAGLAISLTHPACLPAGWRVRVRVFFCYCVLLLLPLRCGGGGRGGRRQTETVTTDSLRSVPDLVINPLTFLCFYISEPLTYLAPTASYAVNMHNKEGLNADITDTNVYGDDVHDRNPVCQGHVSAFPFTPSAVSVSQAFASQLCLPTAMTLGRFASSLCLCVCLCLCVLCVVRCCGGRGGGGRRGGERERLIEPSGSGN